MLNISLPSPPYYPLPAAARHPASLFIEGRHPIIGHTDWQEGLSAAHFWPLPLSLAQLTAVTGTLRVYGTETVTIAVKQLQHAAASQPSGAWHFQHAPDQAIFAYVAWDAAA